MSDLLLHSQKKHKESMFEKLVDDEYEICLYDINNNIERGRDKTEYVVSINKIQKDWDPLVGTYMIIKKLREDDYEVHYIKPTTIIIVHKQKKVTYSKTFDRSKIIKELKEEDYNTRKMLYKKGKLI